MVVTYKPKGDYAWAAVAFALNGMSAVSSLLYSPTVGEKVLAVAAFVAIGLASYALWIRPRLLLSDDYLVVVNPLRSHKIGYEQIVELGTKWALTIELDGRTIRAWAAPASGRTTWTGQFTFTRLTENMRGSSRQANESLPVSASHFSHSGLAAKLINQRIDAHNTL